MKFILITDDIYVATLAARENIDFLMIDLEILGKRKRQGHLNTLISCHSSSSIPLISSILSSSSTQLMVRINPLNANSLHEINEIISLGAQRIMLPMFRNCQQILDILSFVNGRVPLTLLVETSTAYVRLPQILALDHPFDVHIGLNDLHLELKLDFMFELFSCGVIKSISELCLHYNREFGVGGIGRLSGNNLLSAEDILLEHLHYGSSSVILSRDWIPSFYDSTFCYEISSLRSLVSNPPSRDEFKTYATIDKIANRLRSPQF